MTINKHMSKKIDIKEEDLKVSKEAEKTLIDTYLDEGNLVKVGENEYNIRGLTMYARMRICKVLQRIPDDVENTTDSLVKIAATSLEYSAEIAAICIVQRKFTKDMEQNEKLITDMTTQLLLETDTLTQWFFIVMAAVRTFAFDLGTVFQISSLAKATCSTPMRKNPKIVGQNMVLKNQA